MEDVNVFDEPSDVGVRRRLKQGAIRNDINLGDSDTGVLSKSWVSPLDTKVQAALPSMIKSLASCPGLAGLIFQDTAPPGYDGETSDAQLNGTLDLGYTIDNRVAFLRQYHYDPIDADDGDQASMFDPFEGWQQQFDLRLSRFPAISSHPDTWLKYRQDADLLLLKNCFDAAKSANPSLQLYMRERRQGCTIDPWNEPSAVDQIATLDVAQNPYGYVTKSTILVLPLGTLAVMSPGSIAWEVNATRDQVVHGNNGAIALDLVTGSGDTDTIKMLKNMQPYL
jgi:hypothetical protein